MNFENLKNAIDEDASEARETELKIDLGKGKQNPISIIRKNMRFELITILLSAILFLCVPTMYSMNSQAQGIYIVFMTISVLMLLGIAIKFTFFLKESIPLATNTKSSIQAFIYNCKIALAIYKTYSIASALLIPVPVFALIMGNTDSTYYNPELFIQYLFLNLNITELIQMVFIYIVIASAIYLLIILWIRYFYEKHIKKLELILGQLGEI